VTAAGFLASWHWDLPTGPAVVAAFGAAAALAVLRFVTRHGMLCAFFSLLFLSGVLSIGFPQIEQPWFEETQEMFLTEDERGTHADSLQTIAEASAELARLRALEQDVRWGAQEMEPEKQERLRQYVAGRSELLAGEQLVLRDLRAAARERQRYLLGIPLLLLGAGGFARLARRRAK
jgi:hypothetical protein